MVRLLDPEAGEAPLSFQLLVTMRPRASPPIFGPLFPHLGKEAGALGLLECHHSLVSAYNSPPHHTDPSRHSPGPAHTWTRPSHAPGGWGGMEVHRKKGGVLISSYNISLHKHLLNCFLLLLCKTYMFIKEKLENVNKR